METAVRRRKDKRKKKIPLVIMERHLTFGRQVNEQGQRGAWSAKLKGQQLNRQREGAPSLGPKGRYKCLAFRKP